MTFALIIVLAIAIVVGVVLARQKRTYGSVGAAFARDLGESRAALKSARADVKRLEQARQSELSKAEAAVTSLTDRVQELEAPGTGTTLVTLGTARLNAHSLVLGGQTVPLLGLAARCESSPTASYIYADLPDGRSVHQSFSTEWAGTGKLHTSSSKSGGYDVVTVSEETSRDFSDEMVRAFANRIVNQVSAERTFVEQRPELLAQARVDLTGAQARLEETQAGSPLSSDLDNARSHLVSVEKGWAEQTSARRTPTGGTPHAA